MPTVSVVMITYGHENYIEEAINGILKQKCEFDIELIIANDCSPDKTDDVITKILKTHPNSDWIKYTNQKKNIGMMPNFIFALKEAQGKFIALCEGDDYWTDSYKLHKQIEILENNSNVSACFTNALIINEKAKSKKFVVSKKKLYHSNEIVQLGGGFYPTSSIVFRNDNIQYPSFLYNAMSGDHALSLILACHGNFYYLNEVTCAYRMHSGGVFTSIINNSAKRTELNVNNIQLLKNFNKYSSYRFNKQVKTSISKLSKKILMRRTDYKISKSLLNLFLNLNLHDKFSFLYQVGKSRF